MRAHIEDIEWLADSGLSLTAAAERIGVHVESLTRRLQRAGRRDILSRLTRREPGAERCRRCGAWLANSNGLLAHQRYWCPGGRP